MLSSNFHRILQTHTKVLYEKRNHRHLVYISLNLYNFAKLPLLCLFQFAKSNFTYQSLYIIRFTSTVLPQYVYIEAIALREKSFEYYSKDSKALFLSAISKLVFHQWLRIFQRENAPVEEKANWKQSENQWEVVTGRNKAFAAPLPVFNEILEQPLTSFLLPALQLCTLRQKFPSKCRLKHVSIWSQSLTKTFRRILSLATSLKRQLSCAERKKAAHVNENFKW